MDAVRVRVRAFLPFVHIQEPGGDLAACAGRRIASSSDVVGDLLALNLENACDCDGVVVRGSVAAEGPRLGGIWRVRYCDEEDILDAAEVRSASECVVQLVCIIARPWK